MRCCRPLVLAAIASAAKTNDGACDLRDAELYLETLGIPTDLPELEVRYGSFVTKEVYLNGAETQLNVMQDSEMLAEQPRVKWLPSGKDPYAKYAVMMVDPDWPQRSDDGKMPGPNGPKLHWFVLNCKSVASTGHEVYKYEPPEPRTGRHRYIFMLFEQLKPGNLNDFVGKNRQGWDFKGFVRRNRDSLRPLAMNFMYVIGETMSGAEYMQYREEFTNPSHFEEEMQKIDYDSEA